MHDLPFQTLTQFAALGITLVAGWFLGLASASGGRRWRNLYEEEELNNVAYRDESSERLRDNARRIRELETENAQLRAGEPVAAAEPAHQEGHSTAALAGAAIAGAAAGAVAAHAAHEHHHEPAHAAPAHAEPVHAAPVHAAPAPVPVPVPVPIAPAHAEPIAATHAVPAHAPAPEPVIAHGDHGAHPEPAIAAAHASPGADHHATADAHHH